MKVTLLAAALLAAAGTGFGQSDTIFRVIPIDDAGRWAITAEMNITADLLGGATGVAIVWADTGFELTGDGSEITIDAASANPGYTSAIFGSPDIANGPTATFVGVQPGGGLGSPDSSNPLRVVEFDYAGDIASLGMRLVGQNNALFLGDPRKPLGDIRLYQDIDGNPGQLSFKIIIVPVPATLAFAPIALVAARRRR
ncbi:MAG: hypothetical protein AAFR96_03240 [Planctomycetota bacterium]